MRFDHDLTFGLRDGKLIAIEDVDRETEVGLACRCVCPNPHCRMPLQARCREFKLRKRVRRIYFAHHKGAACSGANESALHRLIKEEIAALGKLMLPQYSNLLPSYGPNFRIKVPARLEPLKNIRLETTLDDRIPDLLADTSLGPMCIEVLVTHPCTDEKIFEARRNQWTLVELDARRFLEGEFTRHSIRKWLVDSKEDRKWLAIARARHALSEALSASTPLRIGQDTCPLEMGTIQILPDESSSGCASCPGLTRVAQKEQAVYCAVPNGIKLGPGPTLLRRQPYDLVSRRRELLLADRLAKKTQRELLNAREAMVLSAKRTPVLKAVDRNSEYAQKLFRIENEACEEAFSAISRELRSNFRLETGFEVSRAVAHIVTEVSTDAPKFHRVFSYLVTMDTMQKPRTIKFRRAFPEKGEAEVIVLRVGRDRYVHHFLHWGLPRP